MYVTAILQIMLCMMKCFLKYIKAKQPPNQNHKKDRTGTHLIDSPTTHFCSLKKSPVLSSSLNKTLIQITYRGFQM